MRAHDRHVMCGVITMMMVLMMMMMMMMCNDIVPAIITILHTVTIGTVYY